MSDVLKPDICVIGGGSGGLVVASAAAAFGVSVVLVEKHKMGGDCLNYGCVPSKALIQPKVNFKQVNDHVQGVIAGIAPMDSVERFESLGVNVIEAEARFVDKKTVVAGDKTIKARRFVIATGSSTKAS